MAKIVPFNRRITFETDICEICEGACGKSCGEESCLPLEILRQLCEERNPGAQLAMLRNVAEQFKAGDEH